MAKGQEKPGHNKKKPKQVKTDAPKSAYQQSMGEKGAAAPLLKKR